MANLEAKHSVIKLVPEGGEIIQEGSLLHGVPLNHAVHKPQCTQHDITLSIPQAYAKPKQPKANIARPHDMAAFMQSSMPWSGESCEGTQNSAVSHQGPDMQTFLCQKQVATGSYTAYAC